MWSGCAGRCAAGLPAVECSGAGRRGGGLDAGDVGSVGLEMRVKALGDLIFLLAMVYLTVNTGPALIFAEMRCGLS